MQLVLVLPFHGRLEAADGPRLATEQGHQQATDDQSIERDRSSGGWRHKSAVPSIMRSGLLFLEASIALSSPSKQNPLRLDTATSPTIALASTRRL